MGWRKLAACAAFASTLLGCASKPEKTQPVVEVPPPPQMGVVNSEGRETPFAAYEPKHLEGWAQDDLAVTAKLFEESCPKLASDNKPKSVWASKPSDWAPICAGLAGLKPEEARGFFESNFYAVRLEPDETALLTGYYEPTLNARRKKGGAFQYPIYRKPPELIRVGTRYGVKDAAGHVKPFHSRAKIYAGALDGRGLEIAYLQDPVEAFFLQIQGSGRLDLGEGQATRVGFAAKNGHEYRSAARAMIDWGWATPDTASADRIKAFYKKDPKRGRKVLEANPAYVFFTERADIPADRGPIAAIGLSVTPLRSIAVDRIYTPLGAPVWLDGQGASGPLKRLMLALDTGSAIKGAQRADIYYGSGDEAGALASRTRYPGELFILMPRAVVERHLTTG